MRLLGILCILLSYGSVATAMPVEDRSSTDVRFLSMFSQTSPGSATSDSLLQESLASYELLLATDADANRIHATRQIAFIHAQLGNGPAAARYITQYLQLEFRPEVLSDRYFDPVRENPEFLQVVEGYTPQHSFWSYLYLYIGLMGLYIVLVLVLRRNVDLSARLLIGGFVLIHSAFILHIGLAITNYQFVYPHSYLSSTVFSFLYGPLLYLYFKRTTSGYQLKIRDLLHLVPTVVLLAYLVPIYTLPGAEKLGLMLQRQQAGLNPSDAANLVLIVSLKLASLIAYGWLIRHHFPHVRPGHQNRGKTGIWEQNIYRIHVAYIVCYAIYGVLISNGINSGLLYHAQVVSMALMVTYVGYFASIRPEVFGGSLAFEPALLSKYKKSGLTPSLSLELRDRLTSLFEEEQVYRENDLNLDRLAELLDTTRHNASQVINEHFGLGFHELLNRYRVEAAKHLLVSDPQRNLNVIDIVYEVGYNNKVTFNKAFKKETGLTPTAFQEQNLTLHVNRA